MKKPLVIGLSGCSGSGKSSFLNRIMEGFTGNEVILLSQDNYYLPRNEQPVDENGIKNFDLPESIELSRFQNDIKKLISGESLRLVEYMYNISEAVPRILHISPAKVLLVEGLFIYSDPVISRLLDIKLFIDARENLMLKRRIKRDREERGYELNDVLYRFEKHVIPTYYNSILPHRDSADLVIPNNAGYETAVTVVRGYIKNYLSAGF